jgi:hypothetical protein
LSIELVKPRTNVLKTQELMSYRWGVIKEYVDTKSGSEELRHVKKWIRLYHLSSVAISLIEVLPAKIKSQ